MRLSADAESKKRLMITAGGMSRNIILKMRAGMKKRTLSMVCILSGLVLAGLCGCGKKSGSKTDESESILVASGKENTSTEAGFSYGDAEKGPDYFLNGAGVVIRRGEQPTIGFSQIGAESDWRLASTASMENTFSIDNGYNLIFDNAQQKQENQIKAIREFIDQGVDYIVLDPIVETGWTSSLREAKEAEIPVIIVDREVRLDDEDLYTAWLGSDFRLEGDRACAWLKEYLSGTYDGKSVGIVHIQGTPGSSAQIGRSQALVEAAKENGWNILESVSGDFVQAKGKEVAEAALKEYGDAIQVMYCENDNMAYGAIEALEEAGRKAGPDIENGDVLIVSFDSAKEGLENTMAGKIAVDTECNPLYGPALSRLILSLETGETVEKKNYYEEEQFSSYAPIDSVMLDGKTYPVTMVTQELIKDRIY